MPAILTSIADRLHNRPQLMLTLAAVFWGGNTIAAQLAHGHVTPLQLVFLRWLGVSLLLWPLYGRQVVAYWPVARPRIVRIIATAILGFTGFNVLFYIASLSTSAVNVGILQGSIPVFAMLGAFVWHGTRVSGVQALGVAITLIGVALVATQGTPWAVLSMVLNHGDLLMLCACALYALYAILLQGRPQIPGAVFFTLMAPIAAVTALPMALIEAAGAGYQWPTPEGWLITLYVAIFPSCLSQLFFLRGVDLIGPGQAGVYANLVPIFAAVLAVAILGQVFALYHGIALVLVIGGIALAQRVRSKDA